MKVAAAFLNTLLCCLGAGGAIAASSWAAAAPVTAQEVTLSGTTVSVDQAVKMVEQRFRARVVKVQTQQDAGHTVYVLRLLNDSGRVWTVRVDATSGYVQ